MASGDGVLRCVHPIYACSAIDYPEQVLSTGTKTGECPACTVPHHELGGGIREDPKRDINKILDALDALEETEDFQAFAQQCKDERVKPLVKPFWKDLPFTNIYQTITPDVLHQVYQGIFKHLVNWIKTAYSEVEIDGRFRRLPPNHAVRLFSKGISSLSRVSGQEHAQISRIILGVIIDIPLPGGYSAIRLIRAVHAILDFLYLAQYPVHTDTTLSSLRRALQQFHDNKEIFIDLGIRNSFNLPKLHFAEHYAYLITLFGTTDNYNTEYTERLHIDLAKDAYRSTNHKDEYSQMTQWLERREKIVRHESYIKWRLNDLTIPPVRSFQPRLVFPRELQMAKHPSAKGVSIDMLIDIYGATFFRDALARYTAITTNPNASRSEINRFTEAFHLPITKFPVFYKIKFTSARRFESETRTVDAVHVRPARRDTKGRLIGARFDTAIVNDGTGEAVGMTGTLFKYVGGFLSILYQDTVSLAFVLYSAYRNLQFDTSFLWVLSPLVTLLMWIGSQAFLSNLTQTMECSRFKFFLLAGRTQPSSQSQTSSGVCTYFLALVVGLLRIGLVIQS
jgi:hypothetical protein